MKKLLIFILSILLFSSCSSSQSKTSFNEGIALFKQENFQAAAQSFSIALIQDPKYADAAYNAGIAYLKLKNTDNALFYFEKTVEIAPFHVDAWYNIAVIRYNSDEYKKAVIAAFNALDKGKDLLEKSYKMLASQGFNFRDYAQLKSHRELTISEFQKEDLKELSFILNIDDKGKVKGVSQCTNEDEKLCKYYEDQLKTLEFIPAYAFERDIKTNSDTYCHLTFENKTAALKTYGYGANFKVGKSVIMGALKREVIDDVIRSNIMNYTMCYERQLDKNPHLFGKIVVNFIIHKTGNVASAKINRTSINNPEMLQCVVDVTKNLTFPEPKGGGIVIVNYPFVFKHTSD